MTETSETDSKAALEAAYRFLAHRPRSTEETRLRLARRFSQPVVDEVISFLIELRYLDDEDFARRWVNHRAKLIPKGRRLLAKELYGFGIPDHIVQGALENAAEEDNAFKAARKAAGRIWRDEMPLADWERKLLPFLARRGFSLDTARTVSRFLWEELSSDVLNSQEDADHQKN